MLCSRCKKRQAVVFVSGMFGGHNTENAGYCLTCARELGIPQVEDLLSKFGFSDDDLEMMENQITELSSDPDNPLSKLFSGTITPEGISSVTEELSEILGEGGQDSLFDGFDDYDDDDDDDYDDGDDENDDDEDDGDGDPVIHQLTIRLTGGNKDKDSDDGMDEDDGEGSLEKQRRHPLEEFLGGCFQPGGAVYSDNRGSDEKRGRKGRRKKFKYLDAYCTCLTEKARTGKTDRIIGRDREIERIVQILSRRQKNNPCLIGEPGVGKTAIAEGLSLRIAAGTVPARLVRKEVWLLDLTALVAGTQFRGQFEARIKGLIDEVKSVGNIILFIDEVHNLVGTGDAEGSMNAANILKPALSRGEIQVIGATTFTEYRKYIEKDTALERRFQPVRIEEPSVADTITMLRGIKDYYEEHHGVTFSDALIVRAVNLAERYITDRFLPDKAIDLMDEACACASLRNKALEESQKLCHDLEVNETAQRVLTEESSERSDSDYARLAELRSEEMRIRARINELEPEASENSVTEADLAKVIELWTGIQASRVEESEYAKLANIAERMKEKIKGQDEAVDLVANAIRRTRVQISPHRRPASFIFVGPTGVGKTELVKVLAAELFDTPETLIRLDMSEFMEKHSVSRIIGSPPGYVGYDEAGQLTEKVRRKPYSVLLFDEIEKAHPDVLNILLQILDEGKINDAQGRTVSFENTVIVMTSNAGSNGTSSSLGFGKSDNDMAREKATKALSDFLRPEFLARVDEVVCFNQLGDEEFRAIAKLMCDEYVPQLREKGVELTVTDSALEWLSSHARGGKSAARDLRNLIRREVEDRLALFLLDHTAGDCAVIIDCADDALVLR